VNKIILICLLAIVPISFAEGADKTLDRDLVKAVKNCNQAKLQSLLRRHADPDARMSEPPQAPAVYFAAKQTDSTCLKILGSNGANLEAKVVDVGVTPLMIASLKGNVDAIKYLISKKVAINTADSGGATALHFASSQGNIEGIKLLIQSGADVNVSDKKGLTPLINAAMEGKTEALKFLIRAGANPTTKTNSKFTAYDIAVQSQHTESAAYLKTLTKN
jgi:uncharacterized protein